ncbi:small conductance mechanosensitive channel [Stackebrandtia albiflava]|uniref:Small conductance mechanosensitive channel n=1 Tax=Stackebrandtia albiflava TaxID=406432 RepID=A0A562VAL8_9ACTN|nr:mechanosensitive ion channel family protein [Stackebrandtia albiflava]TWJ14929.1 small conductance mechanosensitive channel [Stackebrandtia albiflava]
MLEALTSSPPACATDAGTACQLLWDMTGQAWLAESSDWLLVKPMRILIIVAVCLLVRGLVNRAIKRLTRPREPGKVPAILKPFRERIPNLMADTDALALMGDRRRARASTIGSVLRSLVTWLVYAIMFMLILAEFNVNLGPLLASAGVVGLAIGFGAQALVKDVISGVFMIMEDQYGVGDLVDLGEASGTVEVVGLRVTTIRDMHGTLWYVRNGEIIRVGNRSQSWANVILDIPLASNVDIDAAGRVISEAVEGLDDDPAFGEAVLEAPDVQGVVDINVEATVFRVVVKADSGSQWALGRELRRRISHHLREAGIADAIADSRVYVRKTTQPPP